MRTFHRPLTARGWSLFDIFFYGIFAIVILFFLLFGAAVVYGIFSGTGYVCTTPSGRVLRGYVTFNDNAWSVFTKDGVVQGAGPIECQTDRGQ